jgi:hypothetical protein
MVVTPAQLRKLALALPGSEEKAHFEQPDFRVNNKIFAGLARDAKTGSLKLTPELQAMLLEARGAAFYPAAGAWGRSGWTHVVLAEAELGELRELLNESWQLVAPKGLRAAPAPELRAKAPRPAKKTGSTSAAKKVASSPAAKKVASSPAAKKDAAKKRARKSHRA